MSSLLNKLTSRFVVRCEEEEIVDPREKLVVECGETKACTPLKLKLDECSARVADGAEERCVEEFFKFTKCVDKFLSHKLFEHL
ncbi:putative ubiquinol-cytochrome c reductase hinge protein variant 1, partial [Paraphysoderma sedebokerense]